MFLMVLLCSVFKHSSNKLNLLLVGISGCMFSIPLVLLILITGAESDSDADRLRFATTLRNPSLCLRLIAVFHLVRFSVGLGTWLLVSFSVFKLI